MLKQKKWLAMLLAVAMVFTMIPATVFAAGNGEGDKTVPGWVDENGGHPKQIQETFDFVVNDIAYKKVDGGVEVARWYWEWEQHKCDQGHVEYVFAGSEYSNRTTLTIPATVEYEGTTYNVIGIGQSAFYEVSGTSNIVLPEGLLYVGEGAFDFKPSVEANITVPSTVTELRDDCFGSEAVKSVTFAENSQLTTIGNFVFRGSDITSVDLPDSVTKIGGRVFEACTNLSSVTIPAGAEFTATPVFGATYQQFSYKGEVVFAEGSKYRYIDGVLCDDDTAIEIREEQKNIVIPEGIKYINEGFRIYDTVQYTSIIESIALPDSLESIGAYAFRDCKALEEIVIPENVTEIGTGAFTSCTSLERAVIKGNVTELNATFSGCSSLSDITIPDTVTKIGNYTFNGCRNLTDFDFSNIQSIGENAFTESGITAIDNTERLTSIGKEAFMNCKDLRKVVFSGELQTIPEAIFYGCGNIEILILPETVSVMELEALTSAFSNDGVVFFTGIVPPKMGEDVFSENESLTVIIPAGSEEAYAANEQFRPFVTNEDGSIKDDISVGVTFPEDTRFCPGETFEVKYILPEGATTGIRFDSTPGMDFKYDWNEETTSYIVTLISGEGTITVTPEINTIEAGTIFKQSKEFTVGHSYGEWKQTKAPDCTNPGTEERVCADCQNKETREITALGHGETELKNAKEATCTAEGYTGDKVCKVCGEVLEQGKAIPKLAHSYKDGKCTVCGAADPNYKPTEPTEPTDPDKGDTDSPQTGDNSNMVLWIALLFVSGAGLFGATVYSRKRKYNR